MNVTFRAMVPNDWEWVYERAAPKVVQDSRGIVAECGGSILAACVLDSWTRGSVQAHMAIDKPMVLRHGFLEEVSKYVFEVCERRVIIGLVPADYEWAVKFNKHIGFEEVARIKDGYDLDIDYVIMQMRREDCRWLRREEDGRQRRTRSA